MNIVDFVQRHTKLCSLIMQIHIHSYFKESLKELMKKSISSIMRQNKCCPASYSGSYAFQTMTIMIDNAD